MRRADDANRKVELLHGIAQLHEDAAGDANAAFDTYARALARRIRRTRRPRKRWIAWRALRTGFMDLAKRLRERSRKSSPMPSSGAGSTRLPLAWSKGTSVTSIGPSSSIARCSASIRPTCGAAESLQTLFQSTERFADMSLVLQRKAEILTDLEEQKAALYQSATLEEEVLERPESAISVYQKVLSLDPEDLRSVDALISLYLKARRWQELLDVYSKKADLVADPEEKKLIYYEVGAVYERELGNVQSSIDTYQKVLELDPDDLTALRPPRRSLSDRGKTGPDLLTVLMHEAELTADPSEAISYQYRIAELYEKHLGDVPRAVELYRDILGVQPDHAPTLGALEGIKNGDKEPLAASGVLEPVYEAMGEWLKLVSVLEIQVRFAQDPFAKVDLLHRIAALYEESLGDVGKSFETFARGVSEDSQNEESLGALERLAMTTERWSAVAKLYDAQLDKLADQPERFVELGLRVAQVYEVQLENVDNAVSRYRRVLDADSENQSAVRALDRLFTQTERWNELAEILSREAEIGQSPEEILEFKYRLGSVHQLRLNDIDKAIVAYSEVINAAPEHVETLRALEGLFESGVKQLEIGQILEPLYQSAGEWERLIRVHEAQLSAISDPEERIQMYYRIAEDAEERLSDPVQAFRVYVRAVRERPLDEKAGEEIERLAAMIEGGWEELANAYADVMSVEGLDAETLAVARTAPRAESSKRSSRTFRRRRNRIASSCPSRRGSRRLSRISTAFIQPPNSRSNSLEFSSSERRSPRTSATRSSSTGRLGQVYEEQLNRVDDAVPRVQEDLRRARAEQSGRHLRAGADLRGQGGVDGSQGRLHAPARERRR